MQNMFDARPPYIRFERRAIPQQHPVEQGGGIFYKDVDFALVTPAGSKEVVEKIVPGWFTHLDSEVMQGRMDARWLDAYRRSYEKWQQGEEMPVDGTAIKNWPVLSPAEVKNLTEQGVRAVEDLAAANEELIARIGMGARALVQKAKDWVVSQQDTAPLVNRLQAQDAIIKAQDVRMKELEQTVAALSQAQSRPAEPVYVRSPEDQLAEVRSRRSETDETDAVNDVVDSMLS